MWLLWLLLLLLLLYWKPISETLWDHPLLKVKVLYFTFGTWWWWVPHLTLSLGVFTFQSLEKWPQKIDLMPRSSLYIGYRTSLELRAQTSFQHGLLCSLSLNCPVVSSGIKPTSPARLCGGVGSRVWKSVSESEEKWYPLRTLLMSPQRVCGGFWEPYGGKMPWKHEMLLLVLLCSVAGDTSHWLRNQSPLLEFWQALQELGCECWFATCK